MNTFEIVATVCGLVQGLLILLKKKENWIFYFGNIGALTIYSFFIHLYGDVIENIVYLTIGAFGTLIWVNEKFAKIFNAEHIKYANNKEKKFYSMFFIFTTLFVYVLIFNTDDPTPFLDSVTTGMGFTATLMMAQKIVESWIVWFFDDVLMAYIYLTIPDISYGLAFLNFVWVFMAVGSYITWRKEAIYYEEL